MSARHPHSGSVPDLIEPVVGFRQWRLEGNGLSSIACDEAWPQPTLVAHCRIGGHPQEAAPASACSCGVHAWYEPCPRTASAPTRDYVAGAVVMWGAIELHMSGMRAERCRIVALAMPLSRWGKRDRVVAVAGHLGVPTVRHRDLSAIAAAHGAPVPAGLRPPPRKACDLATIDRRRTPADGLVDQLDGVRHDGHPYATLDEGVGHPVQSPGPRASRWPPRTRCRVGRRRA